MRTSFLAAAVVVTLALCASVPPEASAHDEDPLEAALESASATGLLVMLAVPEGQCAQAGITKGDILVSYDGVAATSIEVLSKAKAAAGDKEGITCVVVSPGKESREVTLVPGSLGLQLVAVSKESPPAPLPSDDGVVFDADRGGERDEWFVFEIGGAQRGFEHIVQKVDGDILRVTHEVAFDGGEEFGLHHSLVEYSVRCGVLVQPLALSYTNVLNGWASDGHLERDEEGRLLWVAAVGLPDAKETSKVRVRTDIAAVPTYAVIALARQMPSKAGACYRFRPTNDWDGSASLRAALVSEGPETLRIDGKPVETTRIVQRQLGGRALGTYWVDAQRGMVRAEYGGPIATIATREKALQGLSEALEPQTAD